MLILELIFTFIDACLHSQDAYDIEMATTCMAMEFGEDLEKFLMIAF